MYFYEEPPSSSSFWENVLKASVSTLIHEISFKSLFLSGALLVILRQVSPALFAVGVARAVAVVFCCGVVVLMFGEVCAVLTRVSCGKRSFRGQKSWYAFRRKRGIMLFPAVQATAADLAQSKRVACWMDEIRARLTQVGTWHGQKNLSAFISKHWVVSTGFFYLLVQISQRPTFLIHGHTRQS